MTPDHALTVGDLRRMVDDLDGLGDVADELPVMLVVDPTGHERAGWATRWHADGRTLDLIAEARS